jgi:hypothetical protein
MPSAAWRSNPPALTVVPGRGASRLHDGIELYFSSYAKSVLIVVVSEPVVRRE